MANKGNIVRWITIKGKRIPIYEDGTMGGFMEGKTTDTSDPHKEEKIASGKKMVSNDEKNLEGLREQLKKHPNDEHTEEIKARIKKAEERLKESKKTLADREGKKSDHHDTVFGKEFQNKADEYREKFLTKRTDEEIAEIKKNLDKSTAIVGTTEDDHVAYKAIRDEQERRKRDKLSQETYDNRTYAELNDAQKKSIDEELSGKESWSKMQTERSTKEASDIFKNQQEKERRAEANKGKLLEDHSDIQKIAEDHVKKIWNGGATNKELYDAAEKWAEEHNFDKTKAKDAAFAAMNKKQMAEIKRRESEEGSKTFTPNEFLSRDAKAYQEDPRIAMKEGWGKGYLQEVKNHIKNEKKKSIKIGNKEDNMIPWFVAENGEVVRRPREAIEKDLQSAKDSLERAHNMSADSRIRASAKWGPDDFRRKKEEIAKLESILEKGTAIEEKPSKSIKIGNKEVKVKKDKSMDDIFENRTTTRGTTPGMINTMSNTALRTQLRKAGVSSADMKGKDTEELRRMLLAIYKKK